MEGDAQVKDSWHAKRGNEHLWAQFYSGISVAEQTGNLRYSMAMHAFKLYDTFGLPLDFIMDAARDAGIALDQSGFDTPWKSSVNERAQAWKGGSKATASPVYQRPAAHRLSKAITKRVIRPEAKCWPSSNRRAGRQELKPGE